MGDVSLSVGELRRNLKHAKPQARLADVRVGDEDAMYIAKDLVEHPGVTYLRMEECGLTAAGAAHIADALVRGCTLKTLLLGHNKMGDDGALAFAAALKSDADIHLTKLSLAFNNITNAGAIALCEAAKSRPMLVSLDLHGNPVDAATLELVEAVVDRNATILV